MSTLRLPFVASVAWGLHTTLTAPNAPAQSKELVSRRSFHERIAIVLSASIKGFFWAVSLLEMFSILGRNYPNHQLSDLVSNLTLVPTPSPTDSTLSFAFVLGWFLSVAGGLIRKQCYRTLDKHFLFELAIRKDHKLITTGPYAIVRHPGYTGAKFAMIGAIIFYLSPGSGIRACAQVAPKVATIVLAALALAMSGTFVRIRSEDQMLKAQFGEDWDRWARKVPYRLIPWIY